MKTTGVVALALVVMTTAVIGCKQKQPEPIPAPKAGVALAAIAQFRTHFGRDVSRDLRQYLPGKLAIGKNGGVFGL